MTIASICYEKAAIDKGYTNRLLRVDLTNHAIMIEHVSYDVREMFVGGRGYCLKLVYDGTTADTAYNSPDNVLALAGGPFCGESGFAGTGKFIIGSISPLTGTFCDSNVGGYFFPIVKLAGFDAIAITGKSSQEVILQIDGDCGTITIAPAPAKDFSLFDAETYVSHWQGSGKPNDVAYVTTGSGARHTHFGCINSVYYDSRRNRCRTKQAGRGGLGTVMRDKGLWGIVAKGNMARGFSNQPSDRHRLRDAGKKLRQVIRDVDPQAMRLGRQGTTCLIDMMNPNHLLPVHNYQYGKDERAAQVSGTIFEERIFEQKKPDGCFAGCTLSCTKGCEQHTLKTGPFAGQTVAVDGPEYETAAAVTNLGIFNIDAMLEYARRRSVFPV
jgi:aldehyde:ferredoxin oxidoreductase